MKGVEQHTPGLLDSGRRLLDHALGAFSNRVELLAVEFKEEKTNVVDLLICISAVLFFAMMTVIVFTAAVILLFPEDKRVYAAGGFCLLYLSGAIWSILRLKSRLKQNGIPFADSINELKKDREWLRPTN
jgi:uncharacterized membrane protein YqjE